MSYFAIWIGCILRTKILISFVHPMLGLILCVCAAATAAELPSDTAEYERLINLHERYRQDFRVTDRGDYLASMSRSRIAVKSEALTAYRTELRAIDTQKFSVSQQTDYQLVRAEMNGLEFAIRVTQPWFRDPGTYADFARTLRPRGSDPLPAEELIRVRNAIAQWPQVVTQALSNLSPLAEVPADLGRLAIRSLMESEQDLAAARQVVLTHDPDVLPLIDAAQDATKRYRGWLEEHLAGMRGAAGVGRENYNWLLKNVYLMPYTWKDLERMVEMEDNRVVTFQRLEELRNAGQVALKPVQSQAEYRASVQASIEHLFEFIEEKQLFTMPDYLTDEGYFGSWHNFESPWPDRHDYFFNFSHRESLMEEAHEMVGHHFDQLRAEHHPDTIRRGWLPYKISTARAEGFAFALEELLVYAGYLEHRPPRAREVAYEQAAFRTVRATADLRMHDRQWSLEEAMAYAVSNAPHGNLLDDSDHLWFEMGTTLRGVGHHALMVVGKVQFMKLFRDVAQAEGDEFSVRDFMDRFYAKGVIPFSLIRWEMTGLTDEVNQLW
jgi:hypothetical protein